MGKKKKKAKPKIGNKYLQLAQKQAEAKKSAVVYGECPKCPDRCAAKIYIDPTSKKEVQNICWNCRLGINDHRKMAKPK